MNKENNWKLVDHQNSDGTWGAHDEPADEIDPQEARAIRRTFINKFLHLAHFGKHPASLRAIIVSVRNNESQSESYES